MNRHIQTLLTVMSISAMASVAKADVTTYHATTDDRHHIDGNGFSQSGETETFIIASADRKKGQRLTPRVEREFDGKGQIRTGQGVYTFSASYKIDAAMTPPSSSSSITIQNPMTRTSRCVSSRFFQVKTAPSGTSTRATRPRVHCWPRS